MTGTERINTCCGALWPGHTVACKEKPPVVGGGELSGNDITGKREPRGDEAERWKELSGE